MIHKSLKKHILSCFSFPFKKGKRKRSTQSTNSWKLNVHHKMLSKVWCNINWAATSEHEPTVMFAQRRFKSACTIAQSDKNPYLAHFDSLFVLRFYGPVNPMGSCRARRKYFMINLHERMLPTSAKVEPRPPGLQSDGASNWATEAGIFDSKWCKVSSCGQRRLWSDCEDAQTDLSLCCAHVFWRWSLIYLYICLSVRVNNVISPQSRYVTDIKEEVLLYN